ncbi:MAG: hypothetical protein EON90_05260 [Brevundimonas sp.]|nr:MAG: hypothetical protein EON90_05260 [Brevundimonas sp.]
MTISSVNPFVNAMSPASIAIARQTPPGRDPTDARPKEVGDSGATPFNHRSLIDGMKEKLRAEILKEKDMDASSLDRLPAERRASVEAEIGRLVSAKLQESLQRIASTAAQNGQTEGALLDVRA